MSTRLVWTDPSDQSSASDGVSRYGSYLRRNSTMFDDGPTPAEFALAAWRVATGPVMAPGFVLWRADLAIELHFDLDDQDLLLATVSVPVTTFDLSASYRFPEADTWTLTRGWAQTETYEPPRARTGTVAVLPTVGVRVTIDPARLSPVPSRLDDTGELRLAAVRSIGEIINQLDYAAGPVVEQLRS